MRVTIHGPNLADQSKGQFHVHAAECSDNARVGYLFGGDPMAEGWTIDAASIREIVEAVYADQIAESEDDWQAYWDDFHFAPCAKLPTI
jgi:hypothetical protein